MSLRQVQATWTDRVGRHSRSTFFPRGKRSKCRRLVKRNLWPRQVLRWANSFKSKRTCLARGIISLLSCDVELLQNIRSRASTCRRVSNQLADNPVAKGNPVTRKNLLLLICLRDPISVNSSSVDVKGSSCRANTRGLVG